MTDKPFVTKGSEEYFAERERRINGQITEAKSKIEEIEARVRGEIVEIQAKRDTLRHHLQGFIDARNAMAERRGAAEQLVAELQAVIWQGVHREDLRRRRERNVKIDEKKMLEWQAWAREPRNREMHSYTCDLVDGFAEVRGALSELFDSIDGRDDMPQSCEIVAAMEKAAKLLDVERST